MELSERKLENEKYRAEERFVEALRSRDMHWGGAAAETNNPEIRWAARDLKRLGVLDEPFIDGETALMKAINRGGAARKEVMKFNPDPNAAGARGVTPLMRAAIMLRFASAKKLIEAGARLDTKDADGLTARDYVPNDVHERDDRKKMLTMKALGMPYNPEDMDDY